MASDIRVLIGNRNGRILGEVEPLLETVSWRLNSAGDAGFWMPSSGSGSEKATLDFLRFGNTILIQFGNGLPDWGGIIDPPRDWKKGKIGVSAYSGEYLLGFRQTDKGRYFSGASVGYIFEKLISEAKDVYPMLVEVGEVWYGGDGHSPEYHFHNLEEVIEKSLTERLSDADWEVVAAEAGGYITFTANLYERKGTRKQGIALVEDKNVRELRLLEQGKIVNWWDVAGEGSSWGEQRLIWSAYDQDSMAAYGLRQDSEIFSDVSLKGTLVANADSLLDDSKEPHNKWKLEVVDDEPGTFASYGVGDEVRLVAPSFGFGGSDVWVQIESREFDAQDGSCKLVVEEVPA